MSSKIRFALIGAGGIAQSYLQAFADNPDGELVSIADVRLPAAQAAASRFANVKACEDYPELFDGPEFDAVIISTPPDTHETIATYFLENGKHVLCEKPFTIGVESARRMIAVANRSGCVLTMASKFRYVSDVMIAKSFVEQGLIGEIVLFENAFTARVDMSGRWNSKPNISGGGVLIDNGAHSLDLTRYFLGPLSEVHAVEGRRFQPIEVEDTVQVFVHTHSGILGTIDLSWSINKELESYIQIHGLLGTIRIGWKESKYKLASTGNWIKFGNGYDKLQAFRDNIRNFSRHLRDGEPLVISQEDAIANVSAIDAGYRSLGRPEWTQLREVVLV